MNSRQKELQQVYLDSEKECLNALKKTYKDALKDIDDKIAMLLGRSDSDMQHVIYQVEYQKALKGQIEAILTQLQGKEFDSISEYLADSYNQGFIGTMYDISGQGIPLIVPIDQKQVVKAIKSETKLSDPLYTKLGKDTKQLSKQIAAEISRGIATAIPYKEIARNIANRAVIPQNNAMRIARTEAHRIRETAAAEAQFKAREKGCDIVKQWLATLDGRTRDSHAAVDGEIREIDEKFSNGLMFPADPHGRAAEVINCRCTLLSKPRWALSDKDLQRQHDRAAYYGLDETENFADFSSKYLNAAQQEADGAQKNTESTGQEKTDESDKKSNVKQTVGTQNKNGALISKVTDDLLQSGIVHNPVQKLHTELSEEEIVKKVSGGDMTNGSCTSICFAYIGNKAGYDVLDYRGGDSCEFFAKTQNIIEVGSLPNVKMAIVEDYSDIKATKTLLKTMEEGKEYLLSTGEHSAIVRKSQKGVDYLELQSPILSGFSNLSTKTLKDRFGCKESHSVSGHKYKSKSILIETETLYNSNEFEYILGYINTSSGSEKKGSSGNVK